MGFFAKKGHIELDVRGMTCGGCVRHVKEALAAVDGVASVEVHLQDAKARVVTKGAPDPAALVAAIKEAGYEATAA